MDTVGWVLLGLLVLGAFVALYWVFRLLGFIIRAPFRLLTHARRPRATGLGAEYERMVKAKRRRGSR